MSEVLSPACTVLIAEESPDLRAYLGATLRSAGYQTREVEAGSSALRAVCEGQVQAAVIDLSLPHMDGMTVLIAARKLTQKLPIVVVSKVGTIESAVEAIKHGADDYLVLPVWEEKLTRAIEEARRRRSSLNGSAPTNWRPAMPVYLEPAGTSRWLPDEPPGGTETLAVVFHETWVGALIASILRAKGYTVLVLSPEEESLTLAAAHAGPIQLLVTRSELPTKTGVEVFEQLAIRHPGLKMVYVEGMPRPAIGFRPSPEIPSVHKPFTPEDVTRLVRVALDRREEETVAFAQAARVTSC